MERRNFSRMILFFNRLGKYQNDYYPDNLNLINFSSHTSFQLLIFPISLLKKVCDHIVNDKLLMKSWLFFITSKTEFIFHNVESLVIFHNVKNRDFFSCNTSAFRFVEKENFFQQYIDMELKKFLIMFEAIFKWQK